MKTISPFIATIMLVILTIAAGLIVYFFLSSFIRAGGTEIEEKKKLTEECIFSDFTAEIAEKGSDYLKIVVIARGSEYFSLGKEFLITYFLEDGTRIMGNVTTLPSDFGNCKDCLKVAEMRVNLTQPNIKKIRISSLKCTGIFYDVNI
jgi:hypothetical protein